jgi:hypothetical protein
VKYSEGATFIKICDTQDSATLAYEGGQYTSINGEGEDLGLKR